MINCRLFSSNRCCTCDGAAIFTVPSFIFLFDRMDFNNSDEKVLIEQVFVNAMEALSEDDQSLPQVINRFSSSTTLSSYSV